MSGFGSSWPCYSRFYLLCCCCLSQAVSKLVDTSVRLRRACFSRFSRFVSQSMCCCWSFLGLLLFSHGLNLNVPSSFWYFLSC